MSHRSSNLTMDMPAPIPYFQNFNNQQNQEIQYGLHSPLDHPSSIQRPQQYVEPSTWMPNQYNPNVGEEEYYAPRQSGQLATPLPSPDFLQNNPDGRLEDESRFCSNQQQEMYQENHESQWNQDAPQEEFPQSSTSSRPLNSKPVEHHEDSLEYGSRKPFISKLAYLLRNPDLYADVIQWDQAGTSFILAPSARLTQDVLPEIFSHGSVSAFTRQLNTYAFRHLSAIQLAEKFSYSPDTITPIKELSAWTHPLFSRDNPTQANKMVPTPSRARAAHQLAKHAMLMEKGTSIAGRGGKGLKEKALKNKKSKANLRNNDDE